MFNIDIFKNEYEKGDIYALEYMEQTIIKELKETNDNKTIYYTYNDYIIQLFYSVKELNKLNDIYENSEHAKHYDYNIYFNLKDILLQELNIIL